MAPESFTRKSDFCSDVWSLGVIFYNMISDTYPFDGDTHHDLFEAVSMDFLEFVPRRIWEDTPVEILDLIEKMLTKDPKKRIKIGEVLKHGCFQEIQRFEVNYNLHDNEITKIQKFLCLSDFSQALLSYSVRYLSHEKVSEAAEKFL